MFVSDDWDLAIDQVQMADDGLYQCQVGAGDTVGPVMSDMVTLTVMVEPGQPRILQGVEMEVMEGRTEVLECQAEGRPQPEVKLTIIICHICLMLCCPDILAS